MTTINTPATVQFHGHNLITINHNGKPYIAMRPVVEAIGLDWTAQLQRVKRNKVLSEGMVMITTPSKSGEQSMTCIPLSMLNGWLFGVDVNRVKPKIRDTLIQYQRECFNVLADYWMKGEAINPRVKAKPTTKALPNCLTVEQQKALQSLVKSRAEAIPDQSKWAGATIRQWSALKSKFGVTTYKEIPEKEFAEALNVVARVVLEGEVLDAEPKGMKTLKWTKLDKDRNAECGHTIIGEVKEWAMRNLPREVGEDVFDAMNDLQRVIVSATTEMQESILHLSQATHYLNRFRGKKIR